MLLINRKIFFITVVIIYAGLFGGCTNEIIINREIGIVPTVRVLNIHNNTMIHTGFLIGTAADNNQVERVEVSLDGGPWQPAVGTTNWIFQLPYARNTWIDGTSHTISVRSVDNISLYSTTTVLSIIKGSNRDVNGDGYADCVVGASSYNSYQGRVYVFHSSSSGVTNTNALSAPTIIDGEAGSMFGWTVVMGDINGDGYADLVVGGRNHNSASGRAYIFHSRGTNGIESTSANLAQTMITGESSSWFSFPLSIGDINGDGYSDLVAGAPFYNSLQGRVYIFYANGSGGGISSMAASSASKIITGSPGDRFGVATAIGDFNGDGYLDLSAGADTYNSNSGRIYIFHNNGAGAITNDTSATAHGIIDGEGTSRLGFSITTGDINGDGFTDLVAGGQGYNANQGRAYVFLANNGGAGIRITNVAQASSTITGEANSAFSGEDGLALGDINGDGHLDLVVGAFTYSSTLGRVYIFYGGVSGQGFAPGSATSASTIISGESPSHLGRAVSAYDYNGDGYADLTAGGGFYSGSRGQIYIFHGDTSGAVIPSVSAASADSIITGEASSSFGFALTW